jgi:hypothetical protein
MISEHDRVVLRRDLSEGALRAGDVGTIVHIYEDGAAYEIEFCTLDGATVTVATVASDDVRPVGKNDLTHARTVSRPSN